MKDLLLTKQLLLNRVVYICTLQQTRTDEERNYLYKLNLQEGTNNLEFVEDIVSQS